MPHNKSMARHFPSKWVHLGTIKNDHSGQWFSGDQVQVLEAKERMLFPGPGRSPVNSPEEETGSPIY